MRKLGKITLLILGSITVFYLAAFVVQNRFLLGMPYVEKGQTSDQVSHLLGLEFIIRDTPTEFEHEYLVHFGTFLLWSCHVKFRLTGPPDPYKFGGPRGVVTGVAWEKYMMKDNGFLSLAESTNYDHQDRNLLHSWYISFSRSPSFR